MSLVGKLAYLRQRDHLTAHELSELAEVPLGTLNKILTGETKDPSVRVIVRICKVFNVPVRYLLEDSVPDDCCLSAYAETEGFVMLSQREADLFYMFRRLDEHGRQSMEMLMETFCHHLPDPLSQAPEKQLICYETIGEGQYGAFADRFLVRKIMTPVDVTIEHTDFTIRMSGPSMEPTYPAGTVLAVSRKEPLHNQIGVFVVNREAFVRKLYSKHGVQKLIAINVDIKTLNLQPGDEILFMGTVLGAVRNFRWV